MLIPVLQKILPSLCFLPSYINPVNPQIKELLKECKTDNNLLNITKSIKLEFCTSSAVELSYGSSQGLNRQKIAICLTPRGSPAPFKS